MYLNIIKINTQYFNMMKEDERPEVDDRNEIDLRRLKNIYLLGRNSSIHIFLF